MNREDVGMDLTFENMDILRKEVQATKLLLSECDEIFIEEGISNIELRGYLSGKLSADEVIELLASQQGERNQCDGCQAGIPLVDGAHRMGRPGGYPDLMRCQKERYEHPEQAEGAQGEREVTPNPSCSMCSGNGYFCEFSTVETCWCCLPEPEPEETVEALKERIESLKAVVTHMKQQRDAAVARAALAQPSPERGQVVVTKKDGIIVAVTRQDAEGRVLSVIAESQPSPAPELERPIAVAYRSSESGNLYEEHYGLKDPEPLMTVAQHDRIRAQDAAQIDAAAALLAFTRGKIVKLKSERDAAQARVVELERQEPEGYVQSLPLKDHQPCRPGEDRANGYTIPVYSRPFAVEDALCKLRAVLCDPVGNVVIEGSDGDREEVQRALGMLAAAPAQGE